MSTRVCPEYLNIHWPLCCRATAEKCTLLFCNRFELSMLSMPVPVAVASPAAGLSRMHNEGLNTLQCSEKDDPGMQEGPRTQTTALRLKDRSSGAQ